MNLIKLINKGTEILKKNSIFTASIDAEILLSISLNKSRDKMLLNQNQKINFSQIKNYINLINRRKRKEPVSLIEKKKIFLGLEFFGE